MCIVGLWLSFLGEHIGNRESFDLLDLHLSYLLTQFQIWVFCVRTWFEITLIWFFILHKL